MGAGSDPLGNFLEMKLHSFCIAGRQHKSGASFEFWANRTEQKVD
jgi:hypothetical protein